MQELADEIGRQTDREIVYRDLPADEYKATLQEVGLPEPVADMLADSDKGIRHGELYDDSGELRELIGRPTTPLSEAIEDALA